MPSRNTYRLGFLLPWTWSISPQLLQQSAAAAPYLGAETRVRNAVLGCNLKNDRMISVRFQGKPFNITVIQVYAPTSNAEEAEVERFYEELQEFLELTPKKEVLSL